MLSADLLESERDRVIHELTVELYSHPTISIRSVLRNKPLTFDLDYDAAISFKETVIDKMVRVGLINIVEYDLIRLTPKGRSIVESGGWNHFILSANRVEQIESQRQVIGINTRQIIINVAIYIAVFIAIILTALYLNT